MHLTHLPRHLLVCQQQGTVLLVLALRLLVAAPTPTAATLLPALAQHQV